MKQQRPDYHSYLLRLWRAGEADTSPWHIMLENPHTGERQTFTGLPDLLAFLWAIVTPQPGVGGDEGDDQ
jgi:hypothetical protein